MILNQLNRIRKIRAMQKEKKDLYKQIFPLFQTILLNTTAVQRHVFIFIALSFIPSIALKIVLYKFMLFIRHLMRMREGSAVINLLMVP